MHLNPSSVRPTQHPSFFTATSSRTFQREVFIMLVDDFGTLTVIDQDQARLSLAGGAGA